jgi:hypothetical protein
LTLPTFDHEQGIRRVILMNDHRVLGEGAVRAALGQASEFLVREALKNLYLLQHE